MIDLSNLLIGIIGVALFIGIAMGAAIFMGPKFDDAQTNAQASDVVQAVAAVAGAVSSYRLATGYGVGPALSSPQALVDGGYLRSVPLNSALPGRPPQIVDAAGSDASGGGSPATFSPRYVVMSLGGAQDLCTIVERKVGGIAGDASVSAQARPMSNAPNRQAGCFRTSSASGGIAAGDYVVYSRI